MVPIIGEWTAFADMEDKLTHFRDWGLIPPKSKNLRPVMVIDGYFGAPIFCEVVGHQNNHRSAVIQISDGYHAVYGEHLAELQPKAYQKLPHGTCFAEILANYVVIDIETTGFSHSNDRIIEIAAARYVYGTQKERFVSLINPGRLIPTEVITLTGITNEDVCNAPTLSEIQDSLLDFIGNSPIVGHNILKFDIPFLAAQMSVTFNNPLIDTLPMAHSVFNLLPRHKLSYLNDVLHLESAGSHRAMNDVDTTNRLLWACLAPNNYEKFYYKAYLNEKTGSNLCKNGQIKARSKETIKPRYQKIDINSIKPSCDKNESGHLCGKTVVFTGSLSIPRDEAMQMAVDAGAILKNSVSNKTSYLVVGKQDIKIVGMDGMSSKEEKAYALNSAGKASIQIISEEQFFSLLQKDVIKLC